MIPQFVQCLLIFLALLYFFVGVICLILCGTENALLASVIVMPSSHNIAASLCCCSVDYFIPAITIIRYEYKPTLNIVVTTRL